MAGERERGRHRQEKSRLAALTLFLDVSLAFSSGGVVGGRLILFIDEIHLVLGAGRSSDGGMDAANLLKPPLVRSPALCLRKCKVLALRECAEC